MRLEVHRPAWELSIVVETEARPQPVLDRMSGLPLGLPAGLWPLCGECQQPMAFVGQLAHQAGRLELGEPTPSRGTQVAYAFICADPKTMLRCHIWQVEPMQQHIARVVVAEAGDLSAFTLPPAVLPVSPRLGLVATGWTTSYDLVDDVNAECLRYGFHATRRSLPAPPLLFDDTVWLDDAEREARRAPAARTKVGGEPLWLQDPWFQNDSERPLRYVHRAEWSEYESTTARLFELPRVLAEAEKARIPGIVTIDGTFVRNERDGTVTLDTSLPGGRLYLLEDTHAGGFALYYIGR